MAQTEANFAADRRPEARRDSGSYLGRRDAPKGARDGPWPTRPTEIGSKCVGSDRSVLVRNWLRLWEHLDTETRRRDLWRVGVSAGNIVGNAPFESLFSSQSFLSRHGDSSAWQRAGRALQSARAGRPRPCLRAVDVFGFSRSSFFCGLRSRAPSLRAPRSAGDAALAVCCVIGASARRTRPGSQGRTGHRRRDPTEASWASGRAGLRQRGPRWVSDGRRVDE
jgi:hypothetical protein